MHFSNNLVPIPRPRYSGSTSTIPTHANRPLYTIVAAVPRTSPSSSTTKHPSRLALKNLIQSAFVLFHPASSFSRIPAAKSPSVIVRRSMNPWSPLRDFSQRKFRQDFAAIRQLPLIFLSPFKYNAAAALETWETLLFSHSEKSVPDVEALELRLSEPDEGTVRTLASLSGDILV